MSKAYQGRYSVKNTSKYDGDPTNVVFRSLWERQLMKFLDENTSVIQWASESIVIPYICGTDKKTHRYFVDFKISFANGKTYLVEVKPERETKIPRQPKIKTKKYLVEVMTYVKNQSKWSAAQKYAADHGWEFVVWTEKTLEGFGIKLLTSK